MWQFLIDIWNAVIFEPTFNLISILIGLLPGHDFGLALLIFALITRFVLYPLTKKQFHSLRISRELQPEIAKIRKENKGNRLAEGIAIRTLYKEKNFNPFASFGYLLLQVPIFIGLFQVINKVTINPKSIVEYSYSWVKEMPRVDTWIDQLDKDPDTFNPTLFGLVDLTQSTIASACDKAAFEEAEKQEAILSGSTADWSANKDFCFRGAYTDNGNEEYVYGYLDQGPGRPAAKTSEPQADQSISVRRDNDQVVASSDLAGNLEYILLPVSKREGFYLAAFVVAVLAAGSQFIISKQMLIQTNKGKPQGFLALIKRQEAGEEVDQSEFQAASQRMIVYFLPILLFIFSIFWASALPFYWFISGLSQYMQQRQFDKKYAETEIEASVNGKKIKASLNAKEKRLGKQAKPKEPVKPETRKRKK